MPASIAYHSRRRQRPFRVAGDQLSPRAVTTLPIRAAVGGRPVFSDAATARRRGFPVLAWESLGQAEQAHQLGQDTLERSRTALGADHPTTLGAAAHLTFLLTLALAQTGEAAQAHDLGTDTLQHSRHALGSDHLITLVAATAVTYALIARQDNQQARVLATTTMRSAVDRLPPGHLIIKALTKAVERTG